MIALDASTAVQSFRDGVYDIAELGEKLQALLDGAGYVSFKYADGSVVSVPAASLVHAMVSTFPRLIVGGRVALEIHGGALIVKTVDSYGALEALVSSHVADSATVKRSHIEELIVSGSLSIRDFSAWAEANGLAGITVSAARVSGVATAEASGVSGDPSTGLSVSVSGEATIGRATFRGEWATDPMYSAAGLVAPNIIGFYSDATLGTTKIVLSSDTMSLEVPRWDGTGSYVSTIRCEIPYHTAAGWEYLEAGSYEAIRGDSSHTEAAEGAMAQFLLWPKWKMEGEYISARTFRVYPGPTSGAAPIVRVENNTPGALSLPHVWQFAKNSDGTGAVSVLATVKLPPYSCKEFEFRHSADANCGYMYPLSLW